MTAPEKACCLETEVIRLLDGDVLLKLDQDLDHCLRFWRICENTCRARHFGQPPFHLHEADVALC